MKVTNKTDKITEKFLDSELNRLELDYKHLGTVSSICAEIKGVVVEFWDDHERSRLPIATAVELLESLPDGAGYGAFWDAIVEAEELTAKAEGE